MVDAGGNDLDASRVCVVVRHQFVEFGDRVGGDHIGTRHHVGLGIDPALWFEIAGFCLDPCQRVKGGDKRQVELVFEPVTGNSRQPVVGMDDIDRIGEKHRSHPIGELVDDAGEIFLGEIHRTGINVDDTKTGLDLNLVGQTVGPPPHINRAVGPDLGQRRNQLSHVDVHPSCIARPRLDQGRGVE